MNDMIIGTGCDIIDIERIEKSIQKESFVRRVFTKREQDMSGGKASFYADNFAVKEAVSKCFGTGVRGFGLTDIECLRDEFGKPYVILHGNAGDIAEKMEIADIQISISNTKSLSMAFAVAQQKGKAERHEKSPYGFTDEGN